MQYVSGQRPVFETLQAIIPKCEIYRGKFDVTLPTIGHSCVSINRLLSHDNLS